MTDIRFDRYYRSATERPKVEWAVEAEAGREVEITAVHPRAGTIRQTITLQ